MSQEKYRLHLAETEDFSNEVICDLKKRFNYSEGAVLQEELRQLLEDVDIFWFRLGYKIDKSVLSSKSKVRILATPVTGIDHIDEDLCEELGVEIICLRGEYEFLKEVRATAEHTLNLAMTLMRNIVPAVLDVKGGNWNRDLFRGRELYKKKVGIIGYGRLGEICAELFSAFGCEIMIYDTQRKASKYMEAQSIKEIILWSDIVSLHVSYNKSNHNLIDSTTISYFDSQTYLINTSRGGLIDEDALYEQLLNKKIAGAALDVLEGEPEVKSNKLINYANNHSNLIITPHIGGNTYESFEKTEKFISQKINTAIEKL